MSSNQQTTAHVGSKRNRRLRSNAGTNAGGEPKRGKTKPDTSKVPIFLRKTYDMIDSCDPTIASWTEDGDMFVVKNQSVFEKTVIPKYFDHSKFSSFNRQLNFYGFRKIQAKPIRNVDIDQETLKHITFYNENFKRGYRELMIKIQRSTKTGGNLNAQEQQKEIEALKQKVVRLETQVHQLYQLLSSGYAIASGGATATTAASGGGHANPPMEVDGPNPPQAQESYLHYDQTPGSGGDDGISPQGPNNRISGGVPTSIALHGQPSFHDVPQRISSNGDIDRKQPPSNSTDISNAMTTTNTVHRTPPENRATLPRHPNAKGGLPNEMPDLPAELERGVSSLSLLRGLSSGFDPNLSLGFSRGISVAANSANSKDMQGGEGQDPNDPMLSTFDKKFFTTLINETNGGDGSAAGGPRVSSTAAGRKEKDENQEWSVGNSTNGTKSESMVNSKQV